MDLEGDNGLAIFEKTPRHSGISAQPKDQKGPANLRFGQAALISSDGEPR